MSCSHRGCWDREISKTNRDWEMSWDPGSWCLYGHKSPVEKGFTICILNQFGKVYFGRSLILYGTQIYNYDSNSLPFVPAFAGQSLSPLPCFAMHAGFSLLGFRVGNFFRDDIEDLEETGNEPGNERVWVQERWCMCTVILDKHRGWLHRRLAWAGREHQNAVCLQESSFGFSFVILARLLAPEHISTEVAYLSFRWSWRPLFNSQKVCLKPNTTFIYCFEYNIYHTMPLFHNNHLFSCACFCSLPIMFEKQLSF